MGQDAELIDALLGRRPPRGILVSTRVAKFAGAMGDKPRVERLAEDEQQAGPQAAHPDCAVLGTGRVSPP